MQNIIGETRGRLEKFLDAEEKSVSAAAFYGSNEKMVNKIPMQNYAKLDKFVPISWL